MPNGLNGSSAWWRERYRAGGAFALACTLEPDTDTDIDPADTCRWLKVMLVASRRVLPDTAPLRDSV